MVCGGFALTGGASSDWTQSCNSAAVFCSALAFRTLRHRVALSGLLFANTHTHTNLKGCQRLLLESSVDSELSLWFKVFTDLLIHLSFPVDLNHEHVHKSDSFQVDSVSLEGRVEPTDLVYFTISESFRLRSKRLLELRRNWTESLTHLATAEKQK